MKSILLSFTLFTFLFLSACGPKTAFSPTKTRTKVASSLLLLENGCKNGNATSEIFNSVQEFIKTYDDYLSSGQNDALALANPVGRIPDHFKSSAFKPHIMGEASLQTKLDKFIKRFYFLKESASSDVSLWNELGQELKRLNSLSSRLKAQKCSLDRLANAKKNDLRDYIKINEKKILFVCESNESDEKCHIRFVNELAQSDKRSMLRLCMRYHRKGFCGREYNRSFPDKLVTFFNHYFSQQEKEYNLFFKMQNKGPFSCQKQGEEKVMTIKTRGFEKVWQKSFMNRESFVKKINNDWGIENKFSIEFTEVSSDEDIAIKFEDSMISFVDGDNANNMTLSSALSGDQLVSIFTHELGHVFGFKDCYVEFFNQKSKNLVYYTLDASQPNLMCEISLEAVVPLAYKQQLLENYCKVD